MSGMEFTAALVSATAWPVTAIVALVFLRRPIERWLQERPSRIKAGPVEVEWDSQISKVEAELDQPGVPDPALLTGSAETQDQDLYVLARVTPTAAIVEASRRVEADLRQRLFKIGAVVQQEGLGALAQLAYREGLINEATQKSVAGLVNLRNLAVHASDRVSPEAALEFVALAQATRYAITESHVERNLRGGKGNISPDDVGSLLAQGQIEQIVDAATAPETSDVKRRQLAVVLVQQGRLDEAVQIAEAIRNRSELRTVCLEIVRQLSPHSEDSSEEWSALDRLRLKLGLPQRRNVLEEMARLGIRPRLSWAEDSGT